MIFSMIISIYANINYIMIKIMITVIDEGKENEKELKKIQKKAMKRRNRNNTKKNKADEKNSDNEDEDEDDDDDDEDIRNSSETFYRPCPLISTAAVHIGRYFLLFGGFNNRLRERSEIWVSTNVKAFYTYCII